MQVWKCESIKVGGGNSQGASGITQVYNIYTWKRKAYERIKIGWGDGLVVRYVTQVQYTMDQVCQELFT